MPSHLGITRTGVSPTEVTLDPGQSHVEIDATYSYRGPQKGVMDLQASAQYSVCSDSRSIFDDQM
jgi:hypothetical protein